MTPKKFLEKRAELLEKKKSTLAKINEDYTEIVDDFIKHNSPVERSKVYELILNGRKRRGFKRFVIYTQEVAVWDIDDIMIRVGGWWLDQDNNPKKWDTMTVLGVSNPAVFSVSENQIANEHPEENDHN